MRNIFVEGVRSAFIRIIRLITYIVIGLIIFYIIGIFTTKKAHALVYKYELYSQVSPSSFTGNISMGNNAVLNANFNVPNNIINQYDILAIKFGNLSLKYSYDYNDSDLEYYCNKWKASNSYSSSGSDYEYSLNELTCTGTANYGTNNDVLVGGNIYIQGAIFYENDSGNKSTCYMSSEYENMLLCPLRHGTQEQVTGMELNIRNGGYTNVNYNVSVNGLRYYFNYESTEIVNGLNGVQQQQQNTITIIQQQIDQEAQQNQYMQSDNVTSSTTNMTTSITTMTDDISQRLSGASELTQIVLAPLALLTGLATDTCAPLVLQVPFVNYTANLPCMKPVFNQYFNGLYSIFTTIISAIMTYWISVKTFSLIKDILDCDNDRIEVIDL